jgi:hypothetical protein
MNQDRDQIRLDLMAVRYLEATERGDLDTIADLWAAAAANPELELLLHELNEELTVAPRSVRRRLWIGLAAASAAACVAFVIWAFGDRRGTNVPKGNSSPQAVPVVVETSPHDPGAAPAASASNASRIALLTADLQGAEMPAFAWPFSDSPVVRGAPAIPADLLN